MKFKNAQQQARYLSVQALYAWLINPKGIHEVQADILSIAKGSNSARTIRFFTDLLLAVYKNHDALEQRIAPYFVDISWHELHPAMRAILLIATYELESNVALSHKVIINEAIDLAKCFAETGGHTFVNATLDKLAHTLRALPPREIKDNTPV